MLCIVLFNLFNNNRQSFAVWQQECGRSGLFECIQIITADQTIDQAF